MRSSLCTASTYGLRFPDQQAFLELDRVNSGDRRGRGSVAGVVRRTHAIFEGCRAEIARSGA